MQLRHITQETCACGAPAVADEVEHASNGHIRTHSNGQRWESRTFACRHRIAWIPNFECLETQRPCRNDPAERATRFNRNRAREMLFGYLDMLDVDEEWKKAVIRYMPPEEME
jgi:hypothetical protein